MEKQLAYLSPTGLKGKTPMGLKIAYRILMALGLVWGISQPAFPEIPDHVAGVINRIGVIGIPSIYAICQTFGWKKPE